MMCALRALAVVHLLCLLYRWVGNGHFRWSLCLSSNNAECTVRTSGPVRALLFPVGRVRRMLLEHSLYVPSGLQCVVWTSRQWNLFRWSTWWILFSGPITLEAFVAGLCPLKAQSTLQTLVPGSVGLSFIRKPSSVGYLLMTLLFWIIDQRDFFM